MHGCRAVCLTLFDWRLDELIPTIMTAYDAINASLTLTWCDGAFVHCKRSVLRVTLTHPSTAYAVLSMTFLTCSLLFPCQPTNSLHENTHQSIMYHALKRTKHQFLTRLSHPGYLCPNAYLTTLDSAAIPSASPFSTRLAVLPSAPP
jgi:hypothetical protein